MSSIAWRISATGRSRTGRVTIPAWQKRQPRVQPRIISMGARLWTNSTKGMIKSVTGGGSVGTMVFSTLGGASGMVGVMAATAPSS